MTTPRIQSVGLPPEKHADRVVQAGMRERAKNHAQLWDTVTAIVTSSSDGSLRAQRKLEQRIRAARARCLYY